MPLSHGMVRPPNALETIEINSSIHAAKSCAWTGNAHQDANVLITPSDMSAQGVDPPPMELRRAPSHSLALRRNKACTPYVPRAWHQHLVESGLISHYPTIPFDLMYSFDAGISPVSQTYTPPNNASTSEHRKILDTMISDELAKGRYIGPFTQSELEAEIGPFRTAPMSIIPKPEQEGKFRIIQNLSHP